MRLRGFAIVALAWFSIGWTQHGIWREIGASDGTLIFVGIVPLVISFSLYAIDSWERSRK